MKKIIICLILILPTAFSFAQSWKKLHYNAVLVDTHNDFPSLSIDEHFSFDQDLYGKANSDLTRAKKGGLDVQLFSIWCDGDKQNPYAWANREIDSVYEWVRRNPSTMMMVYSPEDLQKAVNEKKFAAMLGMEGGHMIENKLDNLDKLYARGVRYMTLTWNNSPSWATSALDETTKKDSLPHKGLTDFGKQIVKRMNDLGMIVDISHVGEQTFWDAINTSTKPVIASHSCVYNLCPHRRNLKDDQIKAIGKNGGVIQLNFYSGFVDSTYERKQAAFLKLHKKELDSMVKAGAQPDLAVQTLYKQYLKETNGFRPPLSLLIDHIDYIVKLIGADHVGLGSDFDGCESTPLGLDGVEDYPLITRTLKKRGYSNEDIVKILGGNFIRVFKETQKH